MGYTPHPIFLRVPPSPPPSHVITLWFSGKPANIFPFLKVLPTVQVMHKIIMLYGQLTKHSNSQNGILLQGNREIYVNIYHIKSIFHHINDIIIKILLSIYSYKIYAFQRLHIDYCNNDCTPHPPGTISFIISMTSY